MSTNPPGPSSIESSRPCEEPVQEYQVNASANYPVIGRTLNLDHFFGPQFPTSTRIREALGQMDQERIKLLDADPGSSQPVSEIGYRLLQLAGYVEDGPAAGTTIYLAPGKSMLTRIETTLQRHLDRLGISAVEMPQIQPVKLWEQSGRYKIFSASGTLMETTSGNTGVLLVPTDETLVAHYAARILTSWRQLPLLLNQTDRLHRNEARPRAGTIRGREFHMQHAYGFFETQEEVDYYFNQILQAYTQVLESFSLPFLVVTASSGSIGKGKSIELMVPSPIGEDNILVCRNPNCGAVHNAEVVGNKSSCTCPACQNEGTWIRAVEVAHVFDLGTVYSSPMRVTYQTRNGSREIPRMISAGMGTSRLLTVLAEFHRDERGLVLPRSVTPYRAHIIPLGQGESGDQCRSRARIIAQQLTRHGVSVVVDTRPDVKNQLAVADLMGMPVRVIVSPKTVSAEHGDILCEVKQRIAPPDTAVLATIPQLRQVL